ncbi:hypothetical protein [Parvibaculum sp.]|jgi:hypothetical protein|uniref:hypothetical protein n=1 Tax=Parvibaculum sp. TaxID=2024848 RepID=UPI003298BA48
MPTQSPRNPLLAWWIGLLIIAAIVIYFAYRFSCMECGHPGGFVEFIVLGIVPIVYLALMYLTLKNQADTEKKK